jgi:hypothetical protein
MRMAASDVLCVYVYVYVYVLCIMRMAASDVLCVLPTNPAPQHNGWLARAASAAAHKDSGRGLNSINLSGAARSRLLRGFLETAGVLMDLLECVFLVTRGGSRAEASSAAPFSLVVRPGVDMGRLNLSPNPNVGTPMCNPTRRLLQPVRGRRARPARRTAAQGLPAAAGLIAVPASYARRAGAAADGEREQ